MNEKALIQRSTAFYRAAHGIGLLTALLMGLAVALPAQAAIPQSERDVLIALYDSTNGDSWTDNSGWNGAPGTECAWFGVYCDQAETHVVSLVSGVKNLTGSCPRSRL